MTPPDLPTNDQTIEMAEMFRLMGDATRLRIILECLKGPVCVGDMVDRLQASQSLVSHHLRLLRAARILKSERRGKHVFYSAADEHISGILTDMSLHVGEPVSELEA